MSRTAKTFVSIGIASGLLLVALHGAAKPPAPAPPPTCPTCPIVYVETNKDRSDLFLVRPDGSGRTLLHAGARGVKFSTPTWSPDGEWIVFSRISDGANQSWLVKWDGSNATPILSPCGNNSREFAWRPVSTPGTNRVWLAFVDQCDAFDLYAVQVDFGSVPPTASSEMYCLTCEGDLGSYEWGDPAWTRDGAHISAVRAEGLPHDYSYVVFDFVDSVPPRLEMGRTLELPGLGSSWVAGDWAHTTNDLVTGNRLVAGIHSFDLLTDDLWWFDVDHDAETMIAGLACLTCGDGVRYDVPQWSPDDSQLLFWVTSPAPTGYFVSPSDPFARPGAPILTGRGTTMIWEGDWNPNPDPQRP